MAARLCNPLPPIKHGKWKRNRDEVALPWLSVKVAQALAGAERPRVRSGHERAQMIFASLDGFWPPEAVGINPDDALHPLNLLSGHFAATDLIFSSVLRVPKPNIPRRTLQVLSMLIFSSSRKAMNCFCDMQIR